MVHIVNSIRFQMVLEGVSFCIGYTIYITIYERTHEKTSHNDKFYNFRLVQNFVSYHCKYSYKENNGSNNNTICEELFSIFKIS